MVKLQQSKNGTYLVPIPKEKIKKLKLEVGNEFDITYDVSGKLVFVRI